MCCPEIQGKKCRHYHTYNLQSKPVPIIRGRYCASQYVLKALKENQVPDKVKWRIFRPCGNLLKPHAKARIAVLPANRPDIRSRMKPSRAVGLWASERGG